MSNVELSGVGASHENDAAVAGVVVEVDMGHPHEGKNEDIIHKQGPSDGVLPIIESAGLRLVAFSLSTCLRKTVSLL